MTNTPERRRKCPVCGERFEVTRRSIKYCSSLCGRIAARKKDTKRKERKTGRKSCAGLVRYCEICGSGFVAKNSFHKYCKECQEHRWENIRGYRRLGDTIPCIVCGEQITRTAALKKMCSHKCAPRPGLLLECKSCGKMLPYEDFYDYRHNLDGKLYRRCKACHRAKMLKKYHDKLVIDNKL